MRAVLFVLAALAVTQMVAGQSQPYTSTLFQSYNSTSSQTGFLQCNESTPVAGVAPANYTPSGDPLVPLTAAQAGQVIVDAVWFGGDIGPALNFEVVGNCSVLQLTSNGGHGTTVYTGPVPLAPNGCKVSWYQQKQYLTVFVSITNTGFAWSVSLPTMTTVRAQTACNGGYQYCPLATGVPCSSVLSLPSTLMADGSMAAAPAIAPSPTPAATPAAKSTTTTSAKPTTTLG